MKKFIALILFVFLTVNTLLSATYVLPQLTVNATADKALSLSVRPTTVTISGPDWVAPDGSKYIGANITVASVNKFHQGRWGATWRDNFGNTYNQYTIVNVATNATVGDLTINGNMTNGKTFTVFFNVYGTQSSSIVMAVRGKSIALVSGMGYPHIQLYNSAGALVGSEYLMTNTITDLLAKSKYTAAFGKLDPFVPYEPVLAVTVPPGTYRVVISGTNNVGGDFRFDMADIP